MPWWPDAAALVGIGSYNTALLAAVDGPAPFEVLKIRKRYMVRAVEVRKFLGLPEPELVEVKAS